MLCLQVFRSCCYVASCKMKRSVGNSDLARGKGHTKERKSFDFGREGLGDGDVVSATMKRQM